MQLTAGGRERGDGDLVTGVVATAWCSTKAVSLAVALSHDTNRVTTVMDDHAFTLREVSSSRTFLSDARDIHVPREVEHPGAAPPTPSWTNAEDDSTGQVLLPVPLSTPPPSSTTRSPPLWSPGHHRRALCHLLPSSTPQLRMT